jgi:hypothetical protein
MRRRLSLARGWRRSSAQSVVGWMAKWYLENMTFTVDVPDTMLRALDVSPAEASAKLRLAAAMKFYELGELSSGAAAELAGIPKPVFLTRLADFGIDARGIGPGHRVSPAS